MPEKVRERQEMENEREIEGGGKEGGGEGRSCLFLMSINKFV